MGSIAERYSHGPHCYWAACQHPCCWEAERRLAKGILPQEIKLPSRECAPINDEFPTLTVVDVSQWTRGKEKFRPLYENNSTDRLMRADNHHSQSCQSSRPLKEQKRKSERTLKLPSLTGLDSTYQSKPQVKVCLSIGKLNTAWIEPLARCPTHTSDMLAMWVPNPDHTPVTHTQNSEERPKSPHVAVKEIFCLPPSETLIKCNIRKKTTGVKKRVRFQLVFSPSISPLMASVSPEQFTVLGHTAGSWQATVESQPSSSSDVQTPNSAKQRPSSAPYRTKDENLLMLRNKPVVFHDIKEKTQKKVPGDVQITYKLDYKNGEKGVDWQNLRAQAYLWKKYNLSNNQEINKDKALPAEGATAPLSPQHFGLSAIPQTVVSHQRNPVLKDTAGKTFPQQQSSPLVSQTRSILKQSSKHSLNPDFQHPLHLLDRDEEVPGSVIPSTPQPLQPEEYLGDKTAYSESDKDSSSCKEVVPQHCQIMPADFQSPGSNKKLQWADLESAESGPEVFCFDPTAPPPSREGQRRMSPWCKRQ